MTSCRPSARRRLLLVSVSINDFQQAVEGRAMGQVYYAPGNYEESGKRRQAAND